MRQAKVSVAKWQQDREGAWICFRVPDDIAAGMVDDLASGKEHILVLKQYRPKRSLDANAYFWTLVNALADSLGIWPMDIYRGYVRDVGGNMFVAPVKTELLSKIADAWCEGHDGRFTEDMGPCKNYEGYSNLRFYFGSSDFDSAQMSRLIDMVVSDCKDCGIETLTPAERAQMLLEWSNG